MGKKIKKIWAKTDPFTSKVTDRLLGDMGLPNISGFNKARESAEEQARLTRDQQEQQAQAMQAMQSNFQADLKGDNLANVVAGGSADIAAGGTDPTKKRRAGGLSATLGL